MYNSLENKILNHWLYMFGGSTVKKILCNFILVFLIFISSCGKSTDKPAQAEKTGSKALKGTITENFKNAQWSNYENKKKKAEFESSKISLFPSEGYALSDIFEKDNNIVVLLQKNEGDIEYYKLSGNTPVLSKLEYENVIDPMVAQDVADDEELWGVQKYNEYELVIKNQYTDIFKDGVKISSVEGVAAIGDIDENGTDELIQRNMDGRELDVYQIVNDRLIKVWTLVSDDEVFDGDIQIGDLNGDEVSEFYVGNTKGNMKKFILTKNGFEEDTAFPVQKDGNSGTYYVLDYNKDNKSDVITLYQNKDVYINLQK